MWPADRAPREPVRSRSCLGSAARLCGIDNRRISRVLLHRLHTVLRAGLRLVSLTDSDDFAVARLEPESVLAALILVDSNLPAIAVLPFRRGLQDEGNANCLGGVLRGLRPYLRA